MAHAPFHSVPLHISCLWMSNRYMMTTQIWVWKSVTQIYKTVDIHMSIFQYWLSVTYRDRWMGLLFSLVSWAVLAIQPWTAIVDCMYTSYENSFLKQKIITTYAMVCGVETWLTCLQCQSTKLMYTSVQDMECVFTEPE